MPDPRISVVIPARNEATYVARAIESIVAQEPRPNDTEVVVAVNASADGTAEAAGAATSIPVRVLTLAEAGTARAKNAGVRAAQGELVVFLDADSRASPNLLAAIRARAAAGSSADSIRIRADRADGADTLDRAFFDLIDWGKGLFDIRANMFWIRRDAFLELGGFDERLNHAEDVDLLRRLARTGRPAGHIGQAFIATSPRRLHRYPAHLGLLTMFLRWSLGHAGIGRRWSY